MSYPPGSTQADHDRAFADEDRETCQTCDGERVVCSSSGIPWSICQCAACDTEQSDKRSCTHCHGTGYEPRPDNSDEDDRYDASLDDDVPF